MRRIVQFILLKPILWASRKFASRPDRTRIFSALSELFRSIKENPGKKGVILDLKKDTRIIVFSDQHRGAKNGADDFMKAEDSYLKALDHYFQNKFLFISLGDCEELWENTFAGVKKHNTLTFESEKRFILQNRLFKVFGNHDLYWDNSPLAAQSIRSIYGKKLKVFEGIVIEKDKPVGSRQSAVGSQLPIAIGTAAGSWQSTADISQKNKNIPVTESKPATTDKLPIADCRLTIFLTHGHQGDASSDGNWFSKFFVANIWAPLQSYVRINPNTPAYDEDTKTLHNLIMYEWSSKYNDLILITGHTHQPVFESLTHPERLYRQLGRALKANDKEEADRIEQEIKRRGRDYKTTPAQFLSVKPSYFNSGCCCFRDGDITGIEITYERISLVKWSVSKGRELLEEMELDKLQELIK
ncbi:MAG TPA: metallophosphoesterase [Chitinophagaceae bacterium]|nr:metallophosphoesterase [Chitinophagaceae bacterium]